MFTRISLLITSCCGQGIDHPEAIAVKRKFSLSVINSGVFHSLFVFSLSLHFLNGTVASWFSCHQFGVICLGLMTHHLSFSVPVCHSVLHCWRLVLVLALLQWSAFHYHSSHCFLHHPANFAVVCVSQQDSSVLDNLSICVGE